MEIDFFKTTLAVLFSFLIISFSFCLPDFPAMLFIGNIIFFIMIIIIKSQQEEKCQNQ